MNTVNKGPSVRATALVPGTEYVMARWTKPNKTFETVRFLGFGSINAPEAIPQLKTITVDSKFYFAKGDELLVADGRVAGNVFIGEGAGHRVTFFAVANTATTEPLTIEGECEDITAQAQIEA